MLTMAILRVPFRFHLAESFPSKSLLNSSSAKTLSYRNFIRFKHLNQSSSLQPYFILLRSSRIFLYIGVSIELYIPDENILKEIEKLVQGNRCQWSLKNVPLWGPPFLVSGVKLLGSVKNLSHIYVAISNSSPAILSEVRTLRSLTFLT